MRGTRENIERLLGNASVENTKSDEGSSKSTEIIRSQDPSNEHHQLGRWYN